MKVATRAMILGSTTLAELLVCVGETLGLEVVTAVGCVKVGVENLECRSAQNRYMSCNLRRRRRRGD